MTLWKAAGFVLFRREAGRHLYLALRNARHGDVGLPKGHGEEGEEAIEIALRETLEETAIRPFRVLGRFRRTIRYAVARGEKEVVYFAAEAASADVRLSREHSSAAWLDLDAILEAVHHVDLRRVLEEAAVFLKDPILRRGLSPSAARGLLVHSVGSGAPVVGHTREVAGMARAIAARWGGVAPEYVESAAWLHDIGRAATHGTRHPLEGFSRVAARGLGGYAPPCLSHFCKGQSFADLDAPDSLKEEMWSACDLDTFEREEQIIALADSLAVGDRRATIEERHADLVRRYGPSRFFDANARVSRTLLASFEADAGVGLYDCLGIPGA